MKLHRKFIFALLGVAALGVAIDSSALTLGRAKGAVFLGQALKLTVPVQVESGEGASALCFDADVFYGDIRQEASRVGVGSEFLPQVQTVNVTITAASVVDEPVVTVYVRAGCENKVSRRYVMLAELAPDASPASNLPRVPLAQSSPMVAAAAASRSTPTGKTAAPVERPARKPKPVAQEPGPKPESAVAVQATPRAPTKPNRRAHLKLEPWDMGQEREANLKSSNELALGDGEDLQARARAAALWRTLNATPQDVQNADKHTQELEAGLAGLRDTTAKNRQILEDLSQRLNKAESERYSNALVYGLLLLLLVSGVGATYLWLRMRRAADDSEPWYRDDGSYGAVEQAESRTHATRGSQTRAGAAVQGPAQEHVPPAVVQQPSAERSAPGLTHVDIDLHLDEPADPLDQWDLSDATNADTKATPPKPVAISGKPADFASSMSATLRSVNTKEMLDVRQQAEFFMTLGQHEEAIALLSESVAIDSEANPLVYLDLLKILHTLGRKMEYDRYRSGFNAIFNGYVPVYADFNQPGSGLEAYPHVCKRIVALWPTGEAVQYIEACLVRAGNANNNAQLFDLGALRDLLMLHGVARRIATSSFDSGYMPFSAAKGLAMDGPSSAGDTQPVPVSPVAPVDGSVDFDLSEPPGNLIDFDSSDLLPPPSSASPAKRRG